MNDRDCTSFLQWALPRLELRWPGFRRVRRQVCKRLNRRIRELGLDGWSGYRARLDADPSEWQALDACCHITISRFFRDRATFEAVRRHVLPDIAARAQRDGRAAEAWSAGCASGEEPYTLALLWRAEIAPAYPSVPLAIVASDVDEAMLARAREGCFKPTSLRELPPSLIEQAFIRTGSRYCIKPDYRTGIDFLDQDLRLQMPSRSFDLILCRYSAFTYFADPLQRRILASLLERLRPQGYLAIGSHERLPDDVSDLVPLAAARQVFQRKAPQPGSAGP